MKLIKLIAVPTFVLAISANPAFSESYVIDEKDSHAFIQFKATHLGYSYVIGRFNDFEGSFDYDENDPGASSASVTIDVSSVDTNHAERDKHLRSADFFDVDTYPTITFNSTSFEESSDGSVTLVGDLAMHGETKSVSINGRHIGNGDDPWGGYRRGLEGSLNLPVAEFGFPEWLGEVEIYLVVEGIKQ